MSKAAYPTTSEIEARLTAAGLTVPATLSLSDIRLMAIDWLESYTRHTPFLVTGTPTAETRYYHEAPRGFLSFKCGFLSSEDVTITIGDDELVEGTDYVLRRDSNDVSGPYTYAELNRSVGQSFNNIEVEGVVGYCTALPQGAWEAVLRYACALAGPDCLMKVTGGISEVSIGNGDARVKFGNSVDKWAEDKMKQAKSMAAKYKLKSL